MVIGQSSVFLELYCVGMKLGAGEISEIVSCLPLKLEDPSSDLRHPHRNQAWLHLSVTLALGKRNGGAQSSLAGLSLKTKVESVKRGRELMNGR